MCLNTLFLLDILFSHSLKIPNCCFFPQFLSYNPKLQQWIVFLSGTTKYVIQGTPSTQHLHSEGQLDISRRSFGKLPSSWGLAWLKVVSMGTDVYSLWEDIEKLAIMVASLKKMWNKVILRKSISQISGLQLSCIFDNNFIVYLFIWFFYWLGSFNKAVHCAKGKLNEMIGLNEKGASIGGGGASTDAPATGAGAQNPQPPPPPPPSVTPSSPGNTDGNSAASKSGSFSGSEFVRSINQSEDEFYLECPFYFNHILFIILQVLLIRI